MFVFINVSSNDKIKDYYIIEKEKVLNYILHVKMLAFYLL